MPRPRNQDQPQPPVAGLPRDMLVAYVLLFLKNWSAHGYQILQTLAMMGFATIDPATVYRALRQMEKEGLVSSFWETGDSGPARRRYQITATGESFLAQWAEALGAYQRFLDRFFALYSGGAAPAGDAGHSEPGVNGTASKPEPAPKQP